MVRWRLVTGDWKLPAIVPYATLRVFVVGKNYRLQDIQLLKSRLKLPAVSYQPSASGAPLTRLLLSNFFGVGQERRRSTNRPILRVLLATVQAGLNSLEPAFAWLAKP